MVTNRLNTKRWFFIFLFVHLTSWTLAPLLVRFTLPMDSIEGALWGHEWQWGYDKNPFMNAWLTEIAIYVGGHSGWMIYLFSQLSVIICFIALFQLSKKILPPLYALLSIFLLEGSQYYNIHAIDFNDNTLELSLWALITLFFYRALKHNQYRDWILTGLFAGLGMMTKYYTAILLAPMFIFLLIHTDVKTYFKKLPLYTGLFIFLLILLPHTVWLFQHDFVTIDYALNRVSSPPTYFNHLFYPGLFIWEQFVTLIPMGILLLLFIYIGKPFIQSPRFIPARFDTVFLLYVGLGPFLLTILLSFLTGIKLRAGWGEPLFSLWGILLLLWIQPSLTPLKFYRAMTLFFAFIMITVIGYSIILIRAPKPSSAHYPGKNIATTLTERWHATYHIPLRYVAGSRWVTGNIAFYSNDRPSVFIDWDKKLSSWINEDDLRREGAIFVWDKDEEDRVSIEIIQARYHTLLPIQLFEFPWLRNNKTPVILKVAFLPPAR